MIHPRRRRVARLTTAFALAFSVLLPAAAPAAAADPVVLRVGTTQPTETNNPWYSYLVSEYEAFQLTYNLLTEFDKDAKPAPGFADTWTRNPDNVTFHIRDGMTWSDGTPATAKDVCFSWGLGLDAIAAKKSIGWGYLEPGLKDAGVTGIDCPDDSTVIVHTTDQSDRVFQIYIPILPEHIWGEFNYKNIDKEKFDGPLVGTGPYLLADSKLNQYARFVRNPTFWGEEKGFADEVVLQFFSDADTMVQALKSGDLDYAHSVNPEQYKQLAADPLFTGTAGKANGWTQLAFNTYGMDGRGPIPNGGPSTKALLDPAFRDALGYAVDKNLLVERVLGGFGDPGTTNVPPALADWHVEPDNPRTFDIEVAKQKLEAAGYPLVDGKRMDKEGKPIALRLYFPNTDDVYKNAGQFVQEWYTQLGIDVTLQGFGSSALGNIVLPPEGDGKAKYDIELWGWSGSPDPNALLEIFTCRAIGTTSDSQYCNPEFDALYAQQAKESGEARKATLAKMQNLIYDEAPYDILFYDANLDVYRNDKFAGWENMPADGTPFFTYGVANYTKLRDATAEPEPTPEAPSAAAPSDGTGQTEAPAAATAKPSASGGTATPGSTTSDSGSNTTLLLGLIAIVVVVVAGGLLYSRRKSAANVEDE